MFNNVCSGDLGVSFYQITLSACINIIFNDNYVNKSPRIARECMSSHVGYLRNECIISHVIVERDSNEKQDSKAANNNVIYIYTSYTL